MATTRPHVPQAARMASFDSIMHEAARYAEVAVQEAQQAAEEAEKHRLDTLSKGHEAHCFSRVAGTIERCNCNLRDWMVWR
jgi:glycine/serine hydroxymethyltransferase